MYEKLSLARRKVHSARRIVVLTGAGVSAESGVPTFRGEDGLWRRHRLEELATPEAFERDPVLVWEWYGWRRRLVAQCAPNAAHRALAALQVRHRAVTLVTQNVDALHDRAFADVVRESGGARRDGRAPHTFELHGSLFRVRCTRCDHRAPHGEDVDAASVETLPRCPACGGLLRPDVVWFGETLDPEVLEGAFGGAREADVCLVVGTSALVHPAASVPLATLRSGGAVIEVNVTPTPLTPQAVASVRGPAGRVLPLLLDGPHPDGFASRPS